MKELVLIKLGGSLITDKSTDSTAYPDVISRLALEIKTAQSSFDGDIIIAHGSGSFGHFAATRYQLKDGAHPPTDHLALPMVAHAAIKINRIVMEIFLANHLPVISFAPASLIIASSKKYARISLTPILLAIKQNYLPILYGDIIFDQEIGFCIYSSETTLSLLAKKLKSHYSQVRGIYCGNTEGVYDARGITISKITPKNLRYVKKSIIGSAGVDVTGGMVHKVEQSLKLVKIGINTMVVNGKTPGNLTKAILNQSVAGTLISS